VRAGLVARPEEYRWSSYAANASGEDNCLICPYDEYVHLGQTLPQRREAYRALCKAELTTEALGRIRNCTQSGTPMGSERFKERREKTLRSKVGGEKRGRPPGLGINGDVRLKQDDASPRTAESAWDALAHGSAAPARSLPRLVQHASRRGRGVADLRSGERCIEQHGLSLRDRRVWQANAAFIDATAHGTIPTPGSMSTGWWNTWSTIAPRRSSSTAGA
jgi:hypothetical protein